MPTIGELDVHPLCLGGNVFGWSADEQTSFAVLDAYAEAGGNFIDTADMYSVWADGNRGGESEAIIGRWMASRGNRDEMVIATKVGKLEPLTTLDTPTVRRACEASLERLQTDRIDLYYAHDDDTDTPLDETVMAFGALVRDGLVREVAASNYSADRLAQAVRFADVHGVARYIAVQPRYSLVARDDVDGELADLCQREDLAIAPYSTLGSGFLTGKYRPGEATPDSVRAQGAAKHLDTERGQAVLKSLDEVAAAHDAEVATVALAWCAQRPGITTPIASARTPEQLPALLALADLELTDDEMTLLDDASAAPS